MFTDPLKNLKALGVRDDHIIADLGAGTGFYSIILGQMAPRGKVYAVDIVQDFLGTIKQKAKDLYLKNIHVLWGDVEKKGGTQIRNQVVDTVVASNIFFQLQNKDNFVEEIKRILKPGGRVLFIDWSPESYIIATKRTFPKSRTKEIFESKGFTVDRDINTGAHHYGMILVKL